VLLLIGGDKSTQKRDIAQAASYLQEHRRRQ
jgi:putative component of toxin-antitoxin plasmid stabilization module